MHDHRQGRRVDRTTIKHLKRIDPDRAAERLWQARQRSRDALPKRIAATEKTNAPAQGSQGPQVIGVCHQIEAFCGDRAVTEQSMIAVD
jgi:hypothetical protein